jgi:hypothetical protein
VFLELDKVIETLPKAEVRARLADKKFNYLVGRMSIPKFFRVFTMSIKLTVFSIKKVCTKR